MFDDYSLPISLEKFAAYLDNNLSDADMQQVSAIIEMDDDMRQLMSQSVMIDEDMEAEDYWEEQLPESLTNEEFDIPDINGFMESESLDDSTTLRSSALHLKDAQEEAPCTSVDDTITNVVTQIPTDDARLSPDDPDSLDKEHYLPRDETNSDHTSDVVDDLIGDNLLGVDV